MWRGHTASKDLASGTSLGNMEVRYTKDALDCNVLSFIAGSENHATDHTSLFENAPPPSVSVRKCVLRKAFLISLL